MPTVLDSGTQTCTVTTNHTLSTQTTHATYCIRLNLANMVDGSTPDRMVIRAYVKTLTGSTEQMEMEQYFEGAQTLKSWCSTPIWSPFSVKFILTQLTGTSRNVEWSVGRIDS